MKGFLLILTFLPVFLSAQSITGHIQSIDGEALIGAHVQWLGTTIGATTDIDGDFVVKFPSDNNRRLIVSYVGFESDTINTRELSEVLIELQSSQILEEIVVKAEQKGTFISNIDPIKTEVITQKELTRSACCDLAGCFNTQASVQPTTTNIVTNAKELRILGLSGVYNQVLIDGFPLIQGLSYTYGISSVPGSLVNTIFVAKGSNSVLQGYESISGQINVILKEPNEADKLFVNAYMNSFNEKQLNVNYAKKWDQWSTILAVHTTQPADKFDKDNDNFLDLPLTKRYSFFNKWKYRDANEWGWHAKIGFRYVDEERVGGQTFFDPTNDTGTTNAYGQVVDFSQEEIYSKFGYRLDDYHHILAFVSAFHQDQNSYYGTTHYDATQSNVYTNLQYELNWKAKHSLKTGFSFRYQDLNENISFGTDTLRRTYAGEYDKEETIGGFFAENTFNWYDDKLTLIAGIRFDKHNDFGWKTVPRLLLRAQLSPTTTGRVSIGSGWRSVNLFSENINLLASSRDVIISEELLAEEAVNYGVNLTHKIYGDEIETQLSFDFYRTAFSNQIFPDYFTDATQAIIKNFEQTSISNGFQAEVGLAFFSRFGTKLAYNYLDVYRITDGKKTVLPFNAKHRASATFSYEPLNKKWQFDANLHWTGEQALAETNAEPESLSYSDSYTVFSAQLTKKWKQFDLYGGCENIFDFRQLQPIRSWDDPFGPLFDTANVWGPTKGREFYLGVRYNIQ